MVLEVVDHTLGAANKAAQRCKGLGEGSHGKVGTVYQAKVTCRAAAANANNPCAVGVIHHDLGTILLGYRYHVGQIGQFTRNREHAVGHDQLTG